jgi:hypothetical protein
MSFYGGLTGGINQTSRTLTSILTVSDGFATMSGGNLTGINNLQLQNLEINDLIVDDTLTVPHISSGSITNSGSISSSNISSSNISSSNISSSNISSSNISTLNGSIQMGSIGDNVYIVGSEIRLIGNVIGYDSGNVVIVDDRIELNAGGGNILASNSGISILGDGNIALSNILTNADFDWVFTSPNNKVIIDTLEVANLNVSLPVSNITIDNSFIGNLQVGNITLLNPIVYENFEAANITATKKFIGPNVSILDRVASRTQAISHLNVGDIKSSSYIFNKNGFDLSTLTSLNQDQNGYVILGPLMIQWGIIPDASSQGATFVPPYSERPYSVQLSRTDTAGGSTGAGAPRILGLSSTGFGIDSVTGSTDKSSCFWLAIGLK